MFGYGDETEFFARFIKDVNATFGGGVDVTHGIDTDAIAASRSCVAVEVLNPITRLAIEAEGASVAVSAATMNRSTAFGAVQRLIGDVRLKVDVARARRAADTRRDGGEETGVVMRNRAAKL